jgi:YbbR domain-containing protein
MKLWSSNIFIRLLSLGGAVAIWVYVVGISNLIYSFPAEIPVEYFNIPENTIIVNNQSTTVRIAVKAQKSVWKTVTANDFRAYVDLKSLQPGDPRTVDVTVSTERSDISIYTVTPKRIDVQLDTLAEKEFPIALKIDGKIGENYTVLDPVSSVENAMVNGAKLRVDSVSAVQALVVLDENATGEVQRSIALRAIDEQGNPIDEITIDPATVDVTIPIQEIKKSKTFGIKVNYNAGELKEGYWIKSVTVFPQTVELLGESSVLEAQDIISTEKVDLIDVSGDVERRVALNVPQGLTLDNQLDRYVTVKVTVTDKQSTRKLTIPINISNIPSGHEVTEVNPLSMEIEIRGSEETLNQINVGDISIEIDGGNLVKGENPMTVDKNNILSPYSSIELSDIPENSLIITLEEKVVD